MAEIKDLTDSSQDQLAVLRSILLRIAQAEHPEKFALVKQIILERLRELEQPAPAEDSNATFIPREFQDSAVVSVSSGKSFPRRAQRVRSEVPCGRLLPVQL